MYTGQNFTVDDNQNIYAQVLSHEIAEMVVNPLANVVNPEVCDACAGNCSNLWLDYFDKNNRFIDGNQHIPPSPSFGYVFFINALVNRAFYNPATECALPGSNTRNVCVYQPMISSVSTPVASSGTNRLDIFGLGTETRCITNGGMEMHGGLLIQVGGLRWSI